MGKTRMASGYFVAVALGLALAPSAVRADDKPQDSGPESPWRVTLGAGAIYHPDYLGSDEYEIQPFPVLKVEYDNLYVETDGPGVKANVLPHGLFEFGPIVKYGEGRDDVEDDVVDRLPEIDDELWVGLFAGYTEKGIFGDRDSLGVEIEAMWAATDDNGSTATLGVTYGLQATQRLQLSIGTSATYADNDYASTYYSIDAAGASASGLSQFSAGDGLRDVGLRVSARYAITRAIGIGAMAGVSRLMDDFADSPIVDERGSATQVFGGMFLTYSF
ncbi:MipA/OmpV family protein [Thalassobaculum salexigens]|uniref:MipA/OmpV family protein n=1 Tax=Thalassobaculum salexigens TaxID=455360 RepID=UPI00248D4279|nr:MipA/OmpV family protein [Thalassobaculum salexigens]